MFTSIVSRFVARFSKQPAGAAAGITQLAMVLVGMPSQILTNYYEHSTSGMSGLMFILGGLASVLWSVHAKREIKSMSLFLPQIPAITCTCVIVGQMIYY